MLETHHTPPADTDQHKAERRYKFAVQIIKHNQPVDLAHINLVFARRYDRRKLKGIVRKAIGNGHVTRRENGFVVTDSVA